MYTKKDIKECWGTGEGAGDEGGRGVLTATPPLIGEAIGHIQFPCA